MSKKIFEVLCIANTGLFLLLILFLILSPEKTRIAVINNTTVLDGFSMTKELRSAAAKGFDKQKRETDSLYKLLEVYSGDNKEVLLQQFISSRETLEQFSQKFSNENTGKIQARINSYAAGFAKENNYTTVIGSAGGNVIYVDKSVDVTKEFLSYINKKYEGFK